MRRGPTFSTLSSSLEICFSSLRLSEILFWSIPPHDTWVCLFVCLFVRIQPEEPNSTSCVGREVNPLGAVAHGQRHKPRACQRQWHIPRTCQFMVSTLQVDELARIAGLTSAPKSNASSATEAALSHALYDVLVLDGGRQIGLFWWRIPMETRIARQLNNTKHTDTYMRTKVCVWGIHTCAHTQRYGNSIYTFFA